MFLNCCLTLAIKHPEHSWTLIYYAVELGLRLPNTTACPVLREMQGRVSLRGPTARTILFFFFKLQEREPPSVSTPVPTSFLTFPRVPWKGRALIVTCFLLSLNAASGFLITFGTRTLTLAPGSATLRVDAILLSFLRQH